MQQHEVKRGRCEGAVRTKTVARDQRETDSEQQIDQCDDRNGRATLTRRLSCTALQGESSSDFATTIPIPRRDAMRQPFSDDGLLADVKLRLAEHDEALAKRKPQPKPAARVR